MTDRKLKVSGHQTFPFRYGWLEKGIRFVKENNDFSAPQAIVDLGVGKNMVESIKYWCEMTGMIKDGSLTNLGSLLLDAENGWDPFLEDNASLWLLHWKMISNPDILTSGGVLFSFLHKPEFSKRDVVEAIYKLMDQEESKKSLSEKIIIRDVDCFVRCYAGKKRFDKKKSGEESFDCPL